jgi:hypothetical protein
VTLSRGWLRSIGASATDGRVTSALDFMENNCNRQFNSTYPGLMGFPAILNKNPKKSKINRSEKIQK